MALKNINLFEQHVEKIVLAVAVLGAGFMAYVAREPVGIANPANPDAKIHPKEIEPEIAKQIQANDAARDKRQREPVPNPLTGIDFVGGYEDFAYGNPLGTSIAKAPEFGPHSIRPDYKSDGGKPDLTYKSIVPDAPQPEGVHATLLQKKVATPKPEVLAQVANGQLPPPPAGNAYESALRNVVAIDGYIPVGKFILDLNTPKDIKQTFVPVELRRGLVYRIRVKRSELLPSGKWSDFTIIEPAKGSPLPTEVLNTTMPDGDLQNRLPDIDTQFQQIQLPTYYWDPATGAAIQPPILTKPIPDAITKEITKLHSDIQQAVQAGSGFVAAPGGNPPLIGPGGATTQPAMMPAQVADIQKLEVQPFAFWDDSVKPDHRYRYQVQVQLVDPGFGWKFGLADQTYKLEPVVPVKDKGFVAVTDEISVHSDLAFFFQNLDFVNKSKLAGLLFFQDPSGRMFKGTFSVEKGMNVTGTVPTGPGASKDVDAKFTVVDFYETPGTPGSNANVHVILRDPNGNLTTRDSSVDSGSTDKTNFEKLVTDGAAAASAAETPPGGAGVVPPVTPAPTPTVTPGRTTPVTPTPPPATHRGPVTGTPLRGN